MRKFLFFSSLVLLAFITTSSIPSSAPKPVLFPQIQKFCDSAQALSINDDHKSALIILSQGIINGKTSDKQAALLITCPNNDFRSLAAQVMLQTLFDKYNYSKLIVTSCGFSVTEMNANFVPVLEKHGFVVTPGNDLMNGKNYFSVTCGTNMSPIIIYSKESNDPSIPKTALMQVKMCSNDEPNCSDLQSAKFKVSLPFTAPTASTSVDDLDKEFTGIATEMLYTVSKTQ